MLGPAHDDGTETEHGVVSRVPEGKGVFLKLAAERSLTLQSMLLTRDPFELDEHQMHASQIASNYLRLREVLLKMGVTSTPSTWVIVRKMLAVASAVALPTTV